MSQTSPSLARAGDCSVCGVPVFLHFDLSNRKRTCAEARRAKKALDAITTSSQHGERSGQASARVLQFHGGGR